MRRPHRNVTARSPIGSPCPGLVRSRDTTPPVPLTRSRGPTHTVRVRRHRHRHDARDSGAAIAQPRHTCMSISLMSHELSITDGLGARNAHPWPRRVNASDVLAAQQFLRRDAGLWRDPRGRGCPSRSVSRRRVSISTRMPSGFVRSMKEECLSCVVPLGEGHLRLLVGEYVRTRPSRAKPPGTRQPAPATTATAGEPGRRRSAAGASGRIAQFLPPGGRMSGWPIKRTLRGSVRVGADPAGSGDDARSRRRRHALATACRPPASGRLRVARVCADRGERQTERALGRGRRLAWQAAATVRARAESLEPSRRLRDDHARDCVGPGRPIRPETATARGS